MALALTFEIGDSARPRGHAVLYFEALGGQGVLATYVLVLPIKMDVVKYLPPLLASQLGGMAGGMVGEGMTSFAAPPMPESVESIAYLQELAKLRDDDLVSGGSVVPGDVAGAMQEAAEAVREYHGLYQRYLESAPEASRERTEQKQSELPDVRRVMYELMSERDRLGELSRLVGTLRFAAERGDNSLLQETEGSVQALRDLLPEHYWVSRVCAAAVDTSERGGRLAQLYVERCYKLLDEDFTAVGELERRIRELSEGG